MAGQAGDIEAESNLRIIEFIQAEPSRFQGIVSGDRLASGPPAKHRDQNDLRTEWGSAKPLPQNRCATSGAATNRHLRSGPAMTFR